MAAEAISKLVHLEDLWMNTDLICAPPVWQSLGDLRSLGMLSHTESEPSEVQNLPRFTEGTFPSLHGLELRINYADASSLFGSTALPPLDRLSLNLVGAGDASQDVLNHVTRIAKTLKWFSIFLESDDGALPPSSIGTLVQLNRLTHLYINTETPLDIEDNDVCTIISAMPQLKHLELAPDPMFSVRPPRLTFKSLNIVAQGCPSLEYLGVYLLVPSASRLPSSRPMFMAPDIRINFGLSKVPNEFTAVALYLSAILPAFTSSIISKPTDNRIASLDPDFASLFQNQKRKWAKVFETIKIAWAHNEKIKADSREGPSSSKASV